MEVPFKFSIPFLDIALGVLSVIGTCSHDKYASTEKRRNVVSEESLILPLSLLNQDEHVQLTAATRTVRQNQRKIYNREKFWRWLFSQILSLSNRHFVLFIFKHLICIDASSTFLYNGRILSVSNSRPLANLRQELDFPMFDILCIQEKSERHAMRTKNQDDACLKD